MSQPKAFRIFGKFSWCAFAMMMAGGTLTTSAPALANSSCSRIFSLVFKASPKRQWAHLNHAELMKKIENEASLYGRTDVLQLARTLESRLSGSTDALQKRYLRDALESLAEFQNPRLQDFVARVHQEVERHGQAVQEGLMEALQPFFTKEAAAARVKSFSTGRGNLEHVMGKFSQAELLKHVLGPKPDEIAPESLMGRFLHEAEKIGAVTVERRGFQDFEQSLEGPARFLVGIRSSHVEIYNKYFGNVHFLTHNHSVQQGTLLISNNGSIGSYSRLMEPVRSQGDGAIWPSILMSSSEANRFRLFAELGKADQNMAMYPWALGKLDLAQKSFQPYSAKGFFSCCTHWFGNIPIGEAKTQSYLFPKEDNGKVGVSKDLTEYDSFNANGIWSLDQIAWDVSSAQNSGFTAPHPYAKLVWQTPGHQQLWEVLGLKQSQVSGELANPGYVLYALLSKTTVDRVPFVIYISDQAGGALPTNEALRQLIGPR